MSRSFFGGKEAVLSYCFHNVIDFIVGLNLDITVKRVSNDCQIKACLTGCV
jgi:hypothetical protein